MPSTSARQRKTMQAAAHSAKFAKKVGIPQGVARDFARADDTYHGADGGAIMGPMMPGALGVPQGVDYDSLRRRGAQIGFPVRDRGGADVMGAFTPGLPPGLPGLPGMFGQPGHLYANDAGGGGGGMAHGGPVGALGRPVQYFDQGGIAGDAYGDGPASDPSADGGVGGALGWGDPIDPRSRERGIGFGTSPASERGLIGLVGQMMGLPGLGAIASVAERAADYAEAHGIATDRDPVTGISAGGPSSETGGGLAGQGPSPGEVIAPGALTAPAPTVASQGAVLPPLPTLQRPVIDPLTYAFGPAAAWLR